MIAYNKIKEDYSKYYKIKEISIRHKQINWNIKYKYIKIKLKI